MTISEVIDLVRTGQGSEDDWLYIVGVDDEDDDVPLNMEAELGAAPLVENDYADEEDEILPEGFDERGLHCTIDYLTLKDCIEWGDKLAGGSSNSAALDIINYYFKFDAFPDQLGAPDPPPTEVILARVDREFYDILGEERPGTKCKRDACQRGTVQFSVLCRPHHFESVKGKPSPFTD